MRTQAQRIFDKFGGVPKLVEALAQLGPRAQRHPSSVYRWDLPRHKGGCGGVVPSSAMPDVIAAARLCGLAFTPGEDIYNPGRVA